MAASNWRSQSSLRRNVSSANSSPCSGPSIVARDVPRIRSISPSDVSGSEPNEERDQAPRLARRQTNPSVKRKLRGSRADVASIAPPYRSFRITWARFSRTDVPAPRWIAGKRVLQGSPCWVDPTTERLAHPRGLANDDQVLRCVDVDESRSRTRTAAAYRAGPCWDIPGTLFESLVGVASNERALVGGEQALYRVHVERGGWLLFGSLLYLFDRLGDFFRFRVLEFVEPSRDPVVRVRRVNASR